jgi:nucleotide-binding universal stress UspA family protein
VKILCPTDFSLTARAAARVAIDLAVRTEGTVELLHVVPSSAGDVLALATGAVVVDGQIRTTGQMRLAAERRELGCGAGVETTSWLADGDVESAILSRAAAIEADMIVMAAHGRSTWERFALGSTAERVVRRADRPVLIVPPQAPTFDLGAPRELGGARKPGTARGARPAMRIALAVSGVGASAAALALVRSLRCGPGCDVTVLRLYWPVEEIQRLGLIGARSLGSADPDIVVDLERSLRAQVEPALAGTEKAGEITYAIEPAWGEPAVRILDAASAHGCDLLVMGAESHHGLARVAHPAIASGVAHKASRISVVFVPPSPATPTSARVPAIGTVLAPTDLSAAGNRAIPFAYSLLAAHGGVVELCHVHERSLPAPPYVYDRQEGKLSETERACLESELRALVPRDAERMGITTHVSVIDRAHAADAIVHAAERLGADAIVLGSHGRSGVARALMGSVSQGVVRRSRRPVLVVPSSRNEPS